MVIAKIEIEAIRVDADGGTDCRLMTRRLPVLVISLLALASCRPVNQLDQPKRPAPIPDGGFSMETGHFTQLVWKGTKSVGCGKATCNGLDIYVCNYDPAGNWERQYKQNVLPSSCK